MKSDIGKVCRCYHGTRHGRHIKYAESGIITSQYSKNLFHEPGLVTEFNYMLEFAWQTGPTSYKGTGSRDGNLLIVDWGGRQPMLYALNPDGTLSGLWDAGRGSEKLTPLR